MDVQTLGVSLPSIHLPSTWAHLGLSDLFQMLCFIFDFKIGKQPFEDKDLPETASVAAGDYASAHSRQTRGGLMGCMFQPSVQSQSHVQGNTSGMLFLFQKYEKN